MGLKSVVTATKAEEKNYVETSKHIDKVLDPNKKFNEIKSGAKDFQKWSFQEIAKKRIIEENPRLKGCPSLLKLFTEILFYRWSSKKKKTGYINATINQISIGIQLTEEEANAIMLDNSSI